MSQPAVHSHRCAASRLAIASRAIVPTSLAALALSCLATASMAGECLREDQTVRVSGHVVRQHMTRLSDRGSRTQRDTVVSMVLREPLCVMLPDDISLALRPRRIKEVQLLKPERLPNGHDQALLIDGRVQLASSNAHHHPVLIEVSGIPSNRTSTPAAAPNGAPGTALAAARLNH